MKGVAGIDECDMCLKVGGYSKGRWGGGMAVASFFLYGATTKIYKQHETAGCLDAACGGAKSKFLGEGFNLGARFV